MRINSNLILEALEDKFTLFIFVLSNSVFCLEFIVLHGLWVVQIDILRVEHVRAEIKDSSLVDLGCLVFSCVDLRVVLYKIADSLHKLAFFFLCFEVFFFGEVRQANQDVH